MAQEFGSLLTELAGFSKPDAEANLENRGAELVAAFNHLITDISKRYPADIADDLSKKLLNAVRGTSVDRYRNAVRNARGKSK